MLYELNIIFWRNKMLKLTHRQNLIRNSKEEVEDVEQKEALYCLLELTNRKGDDVCNQVLNECRQGSCSMKWKDLYLRCKQRYDDDSGDRISSQSIKSEKEILQLIMSDSNTSETLKKLLSLEINCFGPKMILNTGKNQRMAGEQQTTQKCVKPW